MTDLEQLNAFNERVNERVNRTGFVLMSSTRLRGALSNDRGSARADEKQTPSNRTAVYEALGSGKGALKLAAATTSRKHARPRLMVRGEEPASGGPVDEPGPPDVLRMTFWHSYPLRAEAGG